MKIKEISVSSKRSCQLKAGFFTFECSETIDVQDHTEEEIEYIKRDAYDRCNKLVDEQMFEAQNI